MSHYQCLDASRQSRPRNTVTQCANMTSHSHVASPNVSLSSAATVMSRSSTFCCVVFQSTNYDHSVTDGDVAITLAQETSSSSCTAQMKLTLLLCINHRPRSFTSCHRTSARVPPGHRLITIVTWSELATLPKCSSSPAKRAASSTLVEMLQHCFLTKNW